MPPRTYFEKIQAVLGKYDILFIADEVICGFGRTGNWFGCQTVNALPDSMSIAKNLSAGHAPIAATVISETMYEALRSGSDKLGGFSHGFTFGGHRFPVPSLSRRFPSTKSGTSSVTCAASART